MPDQIIICADGTAIVKYEDCEATRELLVCRHDAVEDVSPYRDWRDMFRQK